MQSIFYVYKKALLDAAVSKHWVKKECREKREIKVETKSVFLLYVLKTWMILNRL